MFYNLPIDLSQMSKERIDAVNSIKYTLFLNNDIPSFPKTTDVIPAIKKACQECCYDLFSVQNHLIKFNFFGAEPRIDESDPKFRTLTYLSYSKSDLDNTFDPLPSFTDMILHHCIFSSYHAIITKLLEGQYVAGYTIRHELLKKGFHQLYSNQLITINDDKISTKFRNCDRNKNVAKSRQASDFEKKAKSHLKYISKMNKLFIKAENIEKKSSEFHNYALQFSALLYTICNTNAASWNFSIQNKNGKQRNIETIFNNIQNIIKNSTDNSYHNIVDLLYHKYLLERLFGFDLISCIIKNINRIESEKNIILGTNIVHVLCKSKELPNTFSRTFFIQYALGHFFTNPDSYNDYWNEVSVLPKSSHVQNVLESTNGIPNGFFQNKWITQFSYFCDYMSKFIIPIYEWCFLDMLLRYVEEHPDTSMGSLEYALCILADYISNHSTELQKVFNEKDITKITNSKKDDLIYPNPEHMQLETAKDYGIEIIKEFLLSNEEMNLNIQLLNPEFFLGITNGQERFLPYREYYRKFYIHVIKELYLDESLEFLSSKKSSKF